MKKSLSLLLTALAITLTSGSVFAEHARVAVASNFTAAMKQIVSGFERQSGHEIDLIFGSTGKIYAQIRNGAPFDAFFAADVKRPQLLEQQGLAVHGSRFSYALGKLVLWSPRPDLIDDEGQVLESARFRHLALANPKLAPYGLAARQVLEAKNLWHKLSARIVQGENIGQTYQFVSSGNAELGFVALSQISTPGETTMGSSWNIPEELYQPIEQQAVQLTQNPAASALLDFIKTSPAAAVIRSYGYATP
jgi:molybdate transport system substrate-binding protein